MIKAIKRLFKSIFLLMGIGFLVFVYAFYIEPSFLYVKKIEISAEKTSADETIRLVQLSDIHIRERYEEDQLEKIVKKVNALEPDIIVFTGDLFDNFSMYNEMDKIIPVLKQLDSKGGKYAVWGNRDYGGGASREYQYIMKEAGFTLLCNQGDTAVTEGGNRIYVGGLDDGLLGNPDYDSLRNSIVEADFKVILLHEPDLADEMKDFDVDLFLAGHSHGGQINLPFFEGVTTSLAKKYQKGFYTINQEKGSRLYVNTGLGTTRTQARFLVPPEITVFDITL